MNIQIVENDEILLVGYKKNTRFGFFVIGQCWRKLHAKKNIIKHRINTDFLIGLNDYSTWDISVERQPAFYLSGQKRGQLTACGRLYL